MIAVIHSHLRFQYHPEQGTVTLHTCRYWLGNHLALIHRIPFTHFWSMALA